MRVRAQDLSNPSFIRVQAMRKLDLIGPENQPAVMLLHRYAKADHQVDRGVPHPFKKASVVHQIFEFRRFQADSTLREALPEPMESPTAAGHCWNGHGPK